MLQLAHLHLLLNHWPIIGLFLAVGLFLVAVRADSDHLTEVTLALFALLALAAIPTYLTGNLAQSVIQTEPGISPVALDAHQVGDKVTVTVWRAGKKMDLEVKLQAVE